MYLSHAIALLGVDVLDKLVVDHLVLAWSITTAIVQVINGHDHLMRFLHVLRVLKHTQKAHKMNSTQLFSTQLASE